MKGITRLAAKLAVFAAVGYGLYFASHYSDGRSVSKWTAPVAPALPEKEAHPAPVRAVAHSEQRTRAQPGSCASQTWPNITPECITGTAEPVKVTERSVPNAEAPSSILLKPTKALDILLDPESTGSLPAGASTRTVTESTRTIGPRRIEAEIRKPKKLKGYARVEGQSHARDGRRLGETRPRKNPLPAAVAQGRRKNPLPAAVAQEPPAAPPSARVSEPIQFRLADRGN
jgi:hypothetical protein